MNFLWMKNTFTALKKAVPRFRSNKDFSSLLVTNQTNY